MKHATFQSFSLKWMVISMMIFIGAELFIGGPVGEYIVGRYTSLSLQFTQQGILNLLSYLIGGFIVGLVSPGLRIHEPAAGAFLSVALMLSLSIFTPYSFIRFSLVKMFIGGVAAFLLALAGAHFGERVAGNRIPS